MSESAKKIGGAANKPAARALAWRTAIAAALNTLGSPRSRSARASQIAKFLAWRARRGTAGAALTRPELLEFRAAMQAAGLSTSSVNNLLSAVKLLLREACEFGIATPAEAQAAASVRCLRSRGSRLGIWLTAESASELLAAGDPSNPLRELRDRALLAVLLGCGLRRAEAAGLQVAHVQRIADRWALVDVIGKGNRVRTVPMALWTYEALRDWLNAAGILDGPVFRRITRHKTVACALQPGSIAHLVKILAARAGVRLATHDLRRTFARLARFGGAPLEQIQHSLGHEKISTTMRYIGVTQDFADAPCDRLGISIAPRRPPGKAAAHERPRTPGVDAARAFRARAEVVAAGPGTQPAPVHPGQGRLSPGRLAAARRLSRANR